MYTICMGNVLTLNIWEDPFSIVPVGTMSFTRKLCMLREYVLKGYYSVGKTKARHR